MSNSGSTRSFARLRRPGRGRSSRAGGGLLAGLRIRVKLVVLHTVFSLLLAGVLAVALRPALTEVIDQAETHEARALLSIARSGADDQLSRLGPDITINRSSGAPQELDLAAAQALRSGGPAAVLYDRSGVPAVVGFDPEKGEYVTVRVVLVGAREAVSRLYIFMAFALLLVYALVAVALEVFILPQHVYGPIRTILRADEALQDGRRDEELVPPSAIPADELGEIMRSRNQSVLALRQHEADLDNALKALEESATDLARKNHLLEAVGRNMQESDRLASLGLMSAGIAHELNTPLAVLKGLVEKVAKASAAGTAFKPGAGQGVTADEAALMLRVLGRLEGLSESLLDFARARPPTTAPVALRSVVQEAWTLVRLDRDAAGVECRNLVPEDLLGLCDGDRIVQVLVNLLRNAVDAITEQGVREAGRRRAEGGSVGRIVVEGRASGPAGTDAARGWATLTITDSGPGIRAETMTRLFEPFVTTRLDARGTGLGLAVAAGIVKEHGGTIIARNRLDGGGAVFELVLPLAAGSIDSARRPVSPVDTPERAAP